MKKRYLILVSLAILFTGACTSDQHSEGGSDSLSADTTAADTTSLSTDKVSTDSIDKIP